MKKQASTKKYILEYTSTNDKRFKTKEIDFEIVKNIYIALISNLTIKAAKIYEIDGKKRTLVEKFTKNKMITLEGVDINEETHNN